MKHTYTDYLFVLFINDGPVSLKMLLEQLEPTGEPSAESYKESQPVLQAMAKNGLIELNRADGTQYIILTESGKEVSTVAADVITASMLFSWHKKAANRPHRAYAASA